MAGQQTIPYTFHKLRQECERAVPDAWKAFLNFYSPLFLHLASLYSTDEAARSEIWRSTLVALSRNDFKAFRNTARQSEREFLVDIRAAFVEAAWGANALASKAQGETKRDNPNSSPASDGVAKILAGLPLAHQEILWFKLAGYTDANIERMMRTTPNVAQGVLDRLDPDYTAARAPVRDACLWPGEWLAFLTQARAAKKEDCPPLHQLLRIHDGQVSWYDKEPTEKRVAGCLHCLENWTALREVGYWRGAALRVPAERIDEWLLSLPIKIDQTQAGVAKKKSLLRRVFG